MAYTKRTLFTSNPKFVKKSVVYNSEWNIFANKSIGVVRYQTKLLRIFEESILQCSSSSKLKNASSHLHKNRDKQ